MDTMCGRYAVTTDPAKLAAEIDAVNEVPEPAGADSTDLDAAPRSPGVNYNVAPTTTVMTVVDRHDPDPGELSVEQVLAAEDWARDQARSMLRP